MRAVFERLAGEQAVEGTVDVRAHLHVLVLQYIAQRLKQPQRRRLALNLAVVAKGQVHERGHRIPAAAVSFNAQNQYRC